MLPKYCKSVCATQNNVHINQSLCKKLGGICIHVRNTVDRASPNGIPDGALRITPLTNSTRTTVPILNGKCIGSNERTLEATHALCLVHEDGPVLFHRSQPLRIQRLPRVPLVCRSLNAFLFQEVECQWNYASADFRKLGRWGLGFCSQWLTVIDMIWGCKRYLPGDVFALSWYKLYGRARHHPHARVMYCPHLNIAFMEMLDFKFTSEYWHVWMTRELIGLQVSVELWHRGT